MTEVRREATFESDPDEVWEAISEEEMLERWLGDEVELDLVEGGDVRVLKDGEERFGRVEQVDEGSRLVFTWGRLGEQESRVELTVAAVPGGARLVVVERATNGVGPTASAAAWTQSLNALHDCLSLVLA